MKHTLIFVVLAVQFNVLFALPHKANPAESIGGNFEGDMILNEEQMNALRHTGKRNGLINTRFRWPNKTVYYELDSDFDDDQKDLIRTSLSELAKYTCIKYKPRTKDTPDYVYVTGNLKGCWSAVGYQGGRQRLNVNYDRCMGAGTIIHEFMHALGFYHMQSASDRDKYVRIIEENIAAGRKGDFHKYPDTVITHFGLPYDYKSVMHYGRDQASKNGEDTIVPLDSTAEIGGRDRPSYSDYRKINIMYGCDCDNK